MKKFFTIIAMFALGLAAQAQTVVDLKALSTDAFTYNSTYYETSTYTVDENTYPAFTYKGGGQWSALELTGTGVKFNYKNSGTKTSFFILTSDYLTVGGKGAQVIVSGAKLGQKITYRVAAKADGGTPSFAAQNALLESGDPSQLVTKDDFIDLVYVVVADGDVTLSESAKGFNIESITIDDGSGEVVIPDGTYIISFDGQSTANKLEYPEGFTLQITGNLEKTLSKGATVTINEKQYQSIKLSNGAENTLTLPEGKVVAGIKLYSYVNADMDPEKPSYWKDIAGFAFENVEQSGGMFTCFKDDLSNLDVRDYVFNGKANQITFTNKGQQCCFVIEVNIETGDPTEVTEVTVNGATPAILIPGDVNGDEAVDGTDIQEVINVMLKSGYTKAADVNGDEVVDGTDIQEVINIMLKN